MRITKIYLLIFLLLSVDVQALSAKALLGKVCGPLLEFASLSSQPLKSVIALQEAAALPWSLPESRAYFEHEAIAKANGGRLISLANFLLSIRIAGKWGGNDITKFFATPVLKPMPMAGQSIYKVLIYDRWFHTDLWMLHQFIWSQIAIQLVQLADWHGQLDWSAPFKPGSDEVVLGMEWEVLSRLSGGGLAHIKNSLRTELEDYQGSDREWARQATEVLLRNLDLPLENKQEYIRRAKRIPLRPAD
jgi:hypothetical protein